MAEIITQMIHFPSNGQTTPGFLAQPEGEEKHPGLVVIQEWWGLVPHIKDVCERFAHQGYIALAPDLYHGEATTEPDEARKLAMDMDRDRAVKEILAAIRYLQSLVYVSPKKIGVVGWCMGGALTIAATVESSDIGASVVYYGGFRDASIAQDIKAPLLGLYAEEDHGISVEMVHSFDQELEAAHVPHEIHVYPGTVHAFFNDARPTTYHPGAAKNAWKRTLAWFEKYLV